MNRIENKEWIKEQKRKQVRDEVENNKDRIEILIDIKRQFGEKIVKDMI